MQGALEALGIILVGFLFVGIITLLISVPIYFASAYSCESRWESRVTDYGLFSGCRVEWQGEMVPEARVWFERNN